MMLMENDLKKRKPTRLKDFDYGTTGAYFVTVCTENRKPILSDIINPVGEGLAPPEYSVKLTSCGEIAKEQLKLLENRFPNVSIENFVIMPNHIHAIIFLHEKTGGASPSPTLNDVICVFKSLTARICKQRFGIEKIFQRSFHDHIIRDREDYEKHVKYICENPMNWYFDELYEEE